MLGLAWLIDQLRNGNLKIAICDNNGNIISTASLSDILTQLTDINTNTSDIDTKIDKYLQQNVLVESALSYDNSAGTTTANYTVFTSDISIDFNGTIVIQIILNISTTTQIKLIPSGQTSSYTAYINAGNSLVANAIYEFEMNVSNGDSINFVIQVPAGDVLSGYLRIFKRER